MFNVVYENYLWMTYNTLLALIPVFLGWLFYEAKTKVFKFLLFGAWLLFVPNTLYVFTDILHLPDGLRNTDLLERVLLFFQYIFLFIAGFATFVYSFFPIDKALKSTKLIIVLNFLIGIGIVLGRVYRLNSWDAIVSFEKVLGAIADLFTSKEMFLLAVLFGLLANFVYFSYLAFNKKSKSRTKKI